MNPGHELLLTWADIALALLVLVSLIVGAVRGFVFEALSLGAWVLAYLGAPFVAPWLVARITPRVDPALAEPAALVLGFVLLLALCSLVARLARALIHATPLQAPDRVLGAGLGLLRGLLLVLLAALVIGISPLRQHPSWLASQARPVCLAVLGVLTPMLSDPLRALVEPTPSPLQES